MLCSLRWIPKGRAASIPSTYQATEEELKEMEQELLEGNEEESTNTKDPSSESSDKQMDDIIAEYKLDEYDDDEHGI